MRLEYSNTMIAKTPMKIAEPISVGIAQSLWSVKCFAMPSSFIASASTARLQIDAIITFRADAKSTVVNALNAITISTKLMR